jgi:hypothetical protein
MKSIVRVLGSVLPMTANLRRTQQPLPVGWAITRSVGGVIGLVVLFAACSSDKSTGDSDAGLSGANAGGATDGGGASSIASGGRTSNGGATNTASGGVTNTGGATNTGGVTNTGGASPTLEAGIDASSGGTTSSGGGRGNAADGGPDASDASARDASAPNGSTDGAAVNPCPPGANFPIGTYELRLYDYYTSEQSGGPPTHGVVQEDLFSRSALITQRLTIALEPPPFGDGVSLYVATSWTPNSEGAYATLDFVNVIPLDEDATKITWDSPDQEPSQHLSFVVHKRSGFVTDFADTSSEASQVPTSDTWTGSGVRVCGAVHDGGREIAQLPPVPVPTNPPPRCSVIQWNNDTSPVPTCETTNWWTGEGVPDNGCIGVHGSSCVDFSSGATGGGTRATCCY